MRVLTPELLDELAADDPRAIRSRRDLVLINVIMRQSVVMAQALLQCPPYRATDSRIARRAYNFMLPAA